MLGIDGFPVIFEQELDWDGQDGKVEITMLNHGRLAIRVINNHANAQAYGRLDAEQSKRMREELNLNQ